MGEIFAKIFEDGNKLYPIVRRLTFCILSIFLTARFFETAKMIEKVLSYLDVGLISSVAKICLGTSVFVVAWAAPIVIVSIFVESFANFQADKLKRGWGKVARTAMLLARYLGSPIVAAIHIEFLSASILLVMGEDIFSAITTLIPNKGCFDFVGLIHVLVWLFELMIFLNDKFKLSD